MKKHYSNSTRHDSFITKVVASYHIPLKCGWSWVSNKLYLLHGNIIWQVWWC